MPANRRRGPLGDLARSDRRSLRALAALVALTFVSAPAARAADFAVSAPRTVSGPIPAPTGRCIAEARPRVAEPSLGVDPSSPGHMVAAWMQGRDPQSGGGQSIGVGVSGDGGRTWQTRRMPGVTHCDGGGAPGAVNPWAAAGPDGHLYVAALAGSAKSDHVVVSHSAGGPDFTEARAIDGAATPDKPTITADPRRAGLVYAAWADFTEDLVMGIPLTDINRFSVSSDGGATWSSPAAIHSPPLGALDVDSQVLVLLDGSLLDIFGEVPQSAVLTGQGAMTVLAMRSTNGGASWGPTQTLGSFSIAPITDPNTGKTVVKFINFSATAGADGSADVAWQDNQSTTSGRVVLARSAAPGKPFGPPTTVARLPAQTFHAAVAAATGGAIGVTWYDFTSNRPGDSTLKVDDWFASSLDHGATWHKLHVAGPTALSSTSDQMSFLAYQSLQPIADGFGALFVVTAPQARYGAADVEFARIDRVPSFGARTNLSISLANDHKPGPLRKLKVILNNTNDFEVLGTLTIIAKSRRTNLGTRKFTLKAHRRAKLAFDLPKRLRVWPANARGLQFVVVAHLRDPRGITRNRTALLALRR